MCVGCREMKPKAELIRVVRTPDDTIAIDPRGKMSGRGVYVCSSRECLARAAKQRQLERALEHPIDKAVFDTLEEIINKAMNNLSTVEASRD